MDRSTFIKGMIPDMHEWYWEAADKFYQSFHPIYPKYFDVRPLSEIKGSFIQMTSALAVGQLPEKKENGPIQEYHASEGFTVYIAKKRFYGKSPVSFELNEDFPRIKNFIRDYIKSNMPQAIENTKEQLAADIFNKGGYTAGDDIFDNSVVGILSPPYGKLLYDGKPFFALSGNDRTAKSGTTYYNGLALALTFDNLKIAHTLFTATNAKQENDEPFDNTQDKRLMVPQALELTADQIINSTLIPGSNNNDKNPLKGAYEVIVNPRLTTATSWALLRKAGLLMYTSNTPDFDFWEDKDTKTLKASFGFTVAIGVKNFRTAVGSNFPTS